jgi:hypothetical protein
MKNSGGEGIMRLFIICMVIISSTILPLCCYSAETLKLRFLTSVNLDDKEGAIKTPEGVTCDDKSSFIVADTGNGRLISYKLEEKKVKGGAEIKIPQITYPIRLQLNSKKDIFVLDGKQHRIAHLSPDGAFVGYVEPQGLDTPSNFVPRSFKIDQSDNIYLLDIYGERVVVLDQAGKLIKKIPLPKSKGFFSDIAVSFGGDILALDSINATVFVAKKDSTAFNPLTKSMHDFMSFPTYLTTNSRGGILVVDQDGGALVSLSLDGTFQGRQLSLGWKPGLLYYPSQICINNEGNVFIADRNNSRIQIFENAK